MALTLKSATGEGSIAGTIILTVPTSKVYTIIGCRASNKDTISSHTFHIKINGVLVTGLNTPLPLGSALDIMVESKIVAEAGDNITAYSDANNAVDIYISYLEQAA